MHARYTSEQMAYIWSDQHKVDLWQRVEVAVIAAYCREGIFPAEIETIAGDHPAPSAQQVAEYEAQTRHDVVAFLRAWTVNQPEQLSSRVHRGLTSSDVVDTALAIQLSETSALLSDQIDRLVAALREHALLHLDVLRIGRTHGQHATRDTWGHRIAEFATAAARARTRFAAAARLASTGKLSGPTGTNENVPVAVERYALTALGIQQPEVSSQIVMRDRLASWMCELAQMATLCEAVATEVRLAQISEVAEVFESSGSAQIGSSAMPHKRNPIRAEKICGLSRVVRGYAIPALEDVVSWQQRDIAHSSVERICLPDAAAATEHILSETTTLISDLAVDEEQMAHNLDQASIAAQTNRAVVALTDQGIAYLTAHDIVSTALHLDEPPNLVGRIILVARDFGSELVPEALVEAVKLPPLDLSHIRETLLELGKQ